LPRPEGPAHPGHVSGAPSSFRVLAKPTGRSATWTAHTASLSKEELYPGCEFRMSENMLTQYLRQVLESHETVRTLGLLA
jgi:hypothetical protein